MCLCYKSRNNDFFTCHPLMLGGTECDAPEARSYQLATPHGAAKLPLPPPAAYADDRPGNCCCILAVAAARILAAAGNLPRNCLQILATMQLQAPRNCLGNCWHLLQPRCWQLLPLSANHQVEDQTYDPIVEVHEAQEDARRVHCGPNLA